MKHNFIAGVCIIAAALGACTNDNDEKRDPVDEEVAAALPLVHEAHGATFRTPAGWVDSDRPGGDPTDYEVESPDGTAVASVGSFEATDSVSLLNSIARDRISAANPENPPGRGAPAEIPIPGADDALFNEVVVEGTPDDFPGPNALSFITAKRGDTVYLLIVFAPDTAENRELVADIVRTLVIG